MIQALLNGLSGKKQKRPGGPLGRQVRRRAHPKPEDLFDATGFPKPSFDLKEISRRHHSNTARRRGQIAYSGGPVTVTATPFWNPT